MADEVNQKAFDGGDTAPHVAEEIKRRNEAGQAYVDAQRAADEKLQEAQQDARDAALELEEQVKSENPFLGSGSAIGEGEGLKAQPGSPAEKVAQKREQTMKEGRTESSTTTAEAKPRRNETG